MKRTILIAFLLLGACGDDKNNRSEPNPVTYPDTVTADVTFASDTTQPPNDADDDAQSTGNDTQSSEFLAGVFSDLDDSSSSFRLEASRRVLDDARITLEAQTFLDVDPDNAISYLQDSDFIVLSLQLFF